MSGLTYLIKTYVQSVLDYNIQTYLVQRTYIPYCSTKAKMNAHKYIIIWMRSYTDIFANTLPISSDEEESQLTAIYCTCTYSWKIWQVKKWPTSGNLGDFRICVLVQMYDGHANTLCVLLCNISFWNNASHSEDKSMELDF